MQTYHRQAEVNCGGGMTPDHFVSWAECSDGTWAGGTGYTAEESERCARAAQEKREAFLRTDARGRLRELLAKTRNGDHLLAYDVTQAIRAIAEILGLDAS
jgi:hypothetical protein